MPELLSRIVFLRGRSDEVIKTLGLSRINFAFLDATHTEPEVRHEFEFVSSRQASGAVVVLDDVTPSLFPGAVAAVDAIAAGGHSPLERITASETCGSAISPAR